MFEGFVVLLGIAFLICVPLSVIIGAQIKRNVNELHRKVDGLSYSLDGALRSLKSAPEKAARPSTPPAPAKPPVDQPTEKPPTPPVQPYQRVAEEKATSYIPPLPPETFEETPEKPKKESASLEQQIGTRWLIMIGSITFLIGVAFFLKYAYDNIVVNPVMRLICAGSIGAVCLGIGEWTQRKDFDLAARGLSALGFAIFYATVYAADGLYHLLPTPMAYLAAVAVTAGTLWYAIRYDAMIMAFLGLLGGFLSPLIFGDQGQMPLLLFGYLGIMSAGYLICSFRLRWNIVSLLTIVGAWLNYAVWFFKDYPFGSRRAALPDEFGIAIFGLLLFFMIYLLMPMVYNLRRRLPAQQRDVQMALSNAVVTLGFLVLMLYRQNRELLAGFSMLLCLLHTGAALTVRYRVREDQLFKLALSFIAAFFLILAVPLYFEMYAVVIAWSAQAALLTWIGVRYGNKYVRLTGFGVAGLAMIWLARMAPYHQETFRLLANSAFVSWLAASIMFGLLHVIYRRHPILSDELNEQLPQILHILSVAGLAAGVLIEGFYHFDVNLGLVAELRDSHFSKLFLWVAGGTLVLLSFGPLAPTGRIGWGAALAVAIGATPYGLYGYAGLFHTSSFTIFFNVAFLTGLAFVAAILAILWKNQQQWRQDESFRQLPTIYGLLAVLTLWLFLTAEIYHYWDLKPNPDSLHDYGRMGQMCISVAWALYAVALMGIGFFKRWIHLRYLSLGFFALALVKVFIFDLSYLESVYRIAGFTVLGLSLIGMSFLYQFARNKGFFDVHGEHELRIEHG